MTPSNLPTKLYRPLSEVKSYVEKMPDGVKLSTLSHKVGAFGGLSRREKQIIVDHLNERESVIVINCKAIRGKNLTTFLRHKKFGYPKEIPGYIYPPKEESAVTPSQPICVNLEQKMQVNERTATPEQLRKQAELLLKEAEEAERLANNNDLFNKKLQPVRLEIMQAIGGVQRKFDEMMDCMSVLEKASTKLRDLQP